MTDHTTSKFSRYTQGTAITIAAGIAAIGATALVLWDADLYAARDKFEHFKLAMFGEWQPQNWCPAGRDSENCQQVSEFVAALEGAENFNFFNSTPIAGTDLNVITGVEFHSALDVVAGEPAHFWCYLNVGNGPVAPRITLASANAGEEPVFNEFGDIDNLVGQLPFDASRLNALARSHCQFNSSNF